MAPTQTTYAKCVTREGESKREGNLVACSDSIRWQLYVHACVRIYSITYWDAYNKVCNLSWKLEQSQAQKRQVDHSLSWKLTSEREGEGKDRGSVEMLCLVIHVSSVWFNPFEPVWTTVCLRESWPLGWFHVSSGQLNLLEPQSEWGNQVRRMVSHELKLGMESCALEMTWRRPLKILGAFQSWIKGGRNSASYDTWCSEIDNLTAYIPVFVRAARGWRAESRLWREPWVSLYRSTGPQSSKGSIHLAARAKHSTTTLDSTGVI